MGDALDARGWDVVGLGLPGAQSEPPAWRVLEPPPTPDDAKEEAASGWLSRLERVAGQAGARVLLPIERGLSRRASPYAKVVAHARERLRSTPRPVRTLAATLGRKSRRTFLEWGLSREEKLLARFWRLSPHLPALQRLAYAQTGPGVWIANDWWMLPIAAAGRDRCGGELVYDSHEFATEEYAELTEWRRFQRPIVAAIEARHIKSARVVTTVSPGIATALEQLYELEQPCLTLRNAPSYRAMPARSLGDRIRLLYQGLLAPGRGLETLIDSAPLWAPRFSLHLRGPAQSSEYLELLKARARAVADARIEFLPPAPMTALVEAALEFDLGLMILPDHSLHARFALPNKLFEYMMAGLALVVTDLPEMRALVEQTGAGYIVERADAQSIAAVVNSLSPADIAKRRHAALAAAKTFNWENECGPVLDLYEGLILWRRDGERAA